MSLFTYSVTYSFIYNEYDLTMYDLYLYEWCSVKLRFWNVELLWSHVVIAVNDSLLWKAKNTLFNYESDSSVVIIIAMALFS